MIDSICHQALSMELDGFYFYPVFGGLAGFGGLVGFFGGSLCGSGFADDGQAIVSGVEGRIQFDFYLIESRCG